MHTAGEHCDGENSQESEGLTEQGSQNVPICHKFDII